MNRNGIWIGVTATPGRLDLNNTYANETNRWVYLPPHSKYYVSIIFFLQITVKNIRKPLIIM